MRQPSRSQSTMGYLPAPKRKTECGPFRLFVLMSAVMIFACVMGGCSPAQGNSSSQASTSATQPAAHSTQAANSTPTPFPASAGPAILGANIDTFIAKFGQPNSLPVNGVYEFAIYGNPHANDVTVATQNNKVLGILEDSPTDEGWSEPQAIKSCLTFTPSDSVYKSQETFTDTQDTPTDLQRVYYSRSLAKQFPASDFTDENGDAMTPGMFGIMLTYSTSGVSNFLGCATQVGLNPNMIAGIM